MDADGVGQSVSSRSRVGGERRRGEGGERVREGEAASVLCRRESRSDGESKGNGMEKGKHAKKGKTSASAAAVA